MQGWAFQSQLKPNYSQKKHIISENELSLWPIVRMLASQSQNNMKVLISQTTADKW